MKGKSLKIFFYLLLIVSVAIGLLFLFLNKGESDDTMVSPLLNWAYILLGLGVLLALFLPLIYRSGKGGKSTLRNLGFVVAVLVISWLLASGNPVQSLSLSEEPSKAVLKMTDTVLIMSIILLAVAILTTIFSSLLRRKS